MTDEELTARVTSLEEAVLSLARVELGDSAGHAFRGNQHTGGGGGGGGGGDAKTAAADAYVKLHHEETAAQQTGRSFDSNKLRAAEDNFNQLHSTAESRDAAIDSAFTRNPAPVQNAANMDRAQKLHNYERMHGTQAMLDKMTPAERSAHGRA